MSILLGDICRFVVISEERIIAETLTRDVEVFDIDAQVFAEENLQEAISHIDSQGNYADTMLVHPLQKTTLRRDDEFISRRNLHRSIDIPNIHPIFSSDTRVPWSTLESRCGHYRTHRPSCKPSD